MAGFFLLCLLFIVYLIYIGKHSDEIHEYQAKGEAYHNFDVALTCPRNVKYELQMKLLNTEERWPVLESISPELEEVHGPGWREILKNYDDLYDAYFYYGGALRILLAKKGCIDRMDCSGYYLYSRDFNGKEHHEQHLKKLITTCRIIERELKKSHPDMSGLDLWFVPAGAYDAGKKKWIFSDSINSGKLGFDAKKPDFDGQECPLMRRLW